MTRRPSCLLAVLLSLLPLACEQAFGQAPD